MFAALATAWEMFRSQKVRFLLTVSGIVVGVGSLVIMASILEVGQAVLRDASAQATDQDVITASNDWQQLQNRPDARRLTHEDQAAISGSTLIAPGSQVTAAYGMRDRQAEYKGKPYNPFTIGVDPTALDVFKLRLGKGRKLAGSEFESGARVVLVGASALDGNVEPGDTVRVEGHPYVIVGVLEKKPEMGPGGPWSWNQRIIFPAKTYALDFDPSRRPSSIIVRVAVPAEIQGLVKDYMLATSSVIDVILMSDRSVKSWELEGVSDDSSTEELVMFTIKALLYLTTVFSMIVGGINIMNIMLVTVVERTREIGVRRAVGASQRDILSQFLSETLAITLVGATFGLVGALGLLGVGSWAVTKWVTPWPFQVEPWSVALGLLFSSVIGLTFGIYPAWRASRLDPVEALRYE